MTKTLPLSSLNKPKYPVYVISKGRFKNCLTAKTFIEDGVDFHLVVEPQEAEEYSKRYGSERVIVLPFSNLGLGSIPARNFVWEHSKSLGFDKHWIFDDNISNIYYLFKGKRIRINSNIALTKCEEFANRYENIGILGLNYTFFVVPKSIYKPFFLNVHVYSALLIRNDLPYRWRGRYNEDTDLCLQVLAGGQCTVLINVFSIGKAGTMKMKGGNTDVLYKGHGRLKMARSLERMWPGVVTVIKRFQRPQHHIKANWAYFDQPLIKRKDIDWNNIDSMKIKPILTKRKEIKNVELKQFYEKITKET